MLLEGVTQPPTKTQKLTLTPIGNKLKPSLHPGGVFQQLAKPQKLSPNPPLKKITPSSPPGGIFQQFAKPQKLSPIPSGSFPPSPVPAPSPPNPSSPAGIIQPPTKLQKLNPTPSGGSAPPPPVGTPSNLGGGGSPSGGGTQTLPKTPKNPTALLDPGKKLPGGKLPSLPKPSIPSPKIPGGIGKIFGPLNTISTIVSLGELLGEALIKAKEELDKPLKKIPPSDSSKVYEAPFKGGQCPKPYTVYFNYTDAYWAVNHGQYELIIHSGESAARCGGPVKGLFVKTNPPPSGYDDKTTPQGWSIRALGTGSKGEDYPSTDQTGSSTGWLISAKINKIEPEPPNSFIDNCGDIQASNPPLSFGKLPPYPYPYPYSIGQTTPSSVGSPKPGAPKPATQSFTNPPIIVGLPNGDDLYIDPKTGDVVSPPKPQQPYIGSGTGTGKGTASGGSPASSPAATTITTPVGGVLTSPGTNPIKLDFPNSKSVTIDPKTGQVIKEKGLPGSTTTITTGNNQKFEVDPKTGQIKAPEKTTTQPTSTPDPAIEEIKKKLDDLTAQIIPLGSLISILNQIPSKLDNIDKQTTPEKLKNAAAAGTCSTLQPGGCMAPLAKNAENAANDSANNSNKLDLLNAGLNTLDLGLLKIIDNKLGNVPLVKGVTGALAGIITSKAVDRVLQLGTFAAVVHNAMMLSTAITDTLFEALDNIFAIPALIKDPNAETIDTKEVFTKYLDNFFANLFGATEWKAIKTQWKAYSTIYRAGANIVSSVKEIAEETHQIQDVTRNWVAELGNSLQDDGVISDDNWEPKNPKTRFRSKRFSRLYNIAEGLENVEEAVESLEEVTSSLRNVVEEANEIKENLGTIEKAVGEANAAAKTDREAKIEGLELPNFSLNDLIKE